MAVDGWGEPDQALPRGQLGFEDLVAEPAKAQLGGPQ
jgi:hypothetical protein